VPTVPEPGAMAERTSAEGRAGAGAVTIVRAADAVCVGELLSVTVTVKLEVPLAEGVPEITPVDDERASPAGRLPEVIDQL